MEKETTGLMRHVCPTCGGNLRVDTVRQMYECPFCGVTFDYDYFREANVLELAEKALLAGEYESSRKAYEFMLTKEPNNFVALRGLSLISMRMNRIKELTDIEKYNKINFEKVSKVIDNAVSASLPEDKEYFEVMKGIVDTGHEYIKEDNVLSDARKERRKTMDSANDTEALRDDLYGKDKEIETQLTPSSVKFMLVIGMIIWTLLCVGILVAVHHNPYEKSTTKDDRKTSSVIVNHSSSYPSANMIIDSYTNSDGDVSKSMRMNWLEVQQAQREAEEEREEQLKKEREEERKEEKKRRKDYNNWQEEHKIDFVYFGLAIGVPLVIVIAAFVIFGMRDRKYNKKISKILDVADSQTSSIKQHEAKLDEFRKKIFSDYKRLKELDRNPMLVGKYD